METINGYPKHHKYTKLTKESCKIYTTASYIHSLAALKKIEYNYVFLSDSDKEYYDALSESIYEWQKENFNDIQS